RKLAFENQRDKRFDLQRHSCPACGAKVVFQHNESIETCDFCASKLVRSQFNDDEQLPDIIIPFFITEDEAKQRLLEWAKQHKRKKESKNIINHIDKLQSYYLPYRMVQGKLNGFVHRDGIKRLFHCTAYIKNMAVNTSNQLDNLLLNEIEPFDWSKAQDFEYAYIAGHRAKLTDISENEIHIRALEEAQDEFLPEIQKKFHSRAVDISFDLDNQLLNKNALLPIYFIKDGELSAFMNGQTGRISASCGEEKKYLASWTIKFFIILYFIIIGLFLYFNQPLTLNFELLEVIFGLSLIYLLFGGMALFYLIENRDKFIIYERKTQQGKNTKSYRKNKKLKIEENKNKQENYHSLVCYEKYLGKKFPVQFKFFPLQRIIIMLLNCFMMTFLPVIIALFIRPFMMIANGENIFQFFDGISIAGGAFWYAIFCPGFYLGYLARGLTRFAYEKPFVYQIMPDGSKKRFYAFRTGIFFEIFDYFDPYKRKKGEYELGIFGMFLLSIILALSVLCVFLFAKL
ncbi:MAG: hypothetical protein J6T41_01180, partial [Neisseriaceae bacterium]|nr:hypothetical protein [Neisseriaceae bacterium]